MNLMSKLNLYLDYSNHYTINKAMRTLKREFDIAKRTSHPAHAQEVIKAAKHIHSVLNSQTDERGNLTWPQKVLARNIRKLISWMESNQKHVRPLLSETPEVPDATE